ncbi:MAG: NADH-quinone oxidoreductase subunit L [Acidobacteriota bacterium]|nr:NADH-quinone oxidoreductase subunit L [Acidobacteriota bacterium]
MFELVVALIVLLPLAAALVNGLNLVLGDRFHYTLVQRITCGAIGLALIGAVWVFIQVLIDPAPREVVLYQWLQSGDVNVHVAFLIDSLSAVMMLVVTGFSFGISLYSINYMYNDYSFTRYFSALALFVFSMLILVMGNNFVLLFLGWEAVGVCSYLLIGHYYVRASAARAGTIAFVINRVGDAGFLMGIFLIATHFGTVTYSEVFANLDRIDSGTATAICLTLLLGAIGKSAQLPLGIWLAKAMEGPTPSSALIHAATMVTAGVYMIVRSHALYDMAPNALLVVAIVGAATALYGTAVGLAQTDIKGILASSTTTHLGLMFLACGLGAYAVAIFYLVAHAFLKSYLFLTAPSILHHLHGKVDVRRVQAKESVPLLYWVVLAVTVALLLAPFALWRGEPLTGENPMPLLTLLAGAAMAVFAAGYYSLKLTHRAFDSHEGHGAAASAQKKPNRIKQAVPFAALAGIALIGIALGILPGGIEGTWFQHFLAPVLSAPTGEVAGHPLLALLLLALLALILFCAWATALYFERGRAELPGRTLLKLRGLYSLAANKFYLEELYGRFVVQSCHKLGRFLDRLDTDVVDRAVGAPAAVMPIYGIQATWEESYRAMQGTAHAQALHAALAPVQTSEVGWTRGQRDGIELHAALVPAQTSEDEVEQADKTIHFADTSGVAGWLATTSARTSGWTERELIGRATGGLGWVTDRVSSASGWIESRVVSRAPGMLGGAAELSSAVSGWIEHRVVGRVPNITDTITDFFAAFTEGIEKVIFQKGVHSVLPSTGAFFGRALLGLEQIIGHPLVTAGLLAAGVVMALVFGFHA